MNTRRERITRCGSTRSQEDASGLDVVYFFDHLEFIGKLDHFHHRRLLMGSTQLVCRWTTTLLRGLQLVFLQ